MVEKNKLKFGTKVHYIPFEGCDKSLIENGRVKEIPADGDYVFVVFKCNNHWNKFHCFTSQRANIDDLKFGWYNETE